ncbi:hypothetical protein PENSPDRAFT_649651 [Peniophora sp. CONT]|nr:hypothetical protein PENSPDRAFT_649651 [Peniophora sp. CONT]
MDSLPIVYHIETAQQFWSELEDILRLLPNATLSALDSALKRFVNFCSTYHEQYLQSPLQLEHAIGLLLDSELFEFHSERMCEIITDEARTTTDPHLQLILYNVLLLYGRRTTTFFRHYKRWAPIFPMLMDHVLDLTLSLTLNDSDGAGPDPATTSDHGWLAVPIEEKLRALSIQLLYEACRTCKLTMQELRVFDNAFIERLFELVEQTRAATDESFNYSVIKLIVALNEQFMLAALRGQGDQVGAESIHKGDGENRVFNVLKRRLHMSQTFAENLIFMLNRAGRSPEDLVMQLLVLKLLYLLFQTETTCEYFYTNDLRVLVDVFLRELSDLDDESESLRHTYLRVLHPLLTRTQLRDVPYKRPQLVRMLEGLVDKPEIREVTPTTTRLVSRCLSGAWCVHLRRPQNMVASNSDNLLNAPGDSTPRAGTPGGVAEEHLSPMTPAPKPRPPTSLDRKRSLKGSRSAENLRAGSSPASIMSTAGASSSHNDLSSLPVSPITGPRLRRETPSASRADSCSHRPHRSDDMVQPTRANSLGTGVDGIISPHSFVPGRPLPSIVEPRSLTHSPSPLSQYAEPPSSPPLSPPLRPSAAYRRVSASQPPSGHASPSFPPLSPTSTYSTESRRSSVSSTGSGKTRRSAPPPPPAKRRTPPPPGTRSPLVRDVDAPPTGVVRDTRQEGEAVRGPGMRRKPPAVPPHGHTSSGMRIETIRASAGPPASGRG